MGASCVKDNDGKIGVEKDKLMDVWRAHHDNLRYQMRSLCGIDRV